MLIQSLWIFSYALWMFIQRLWISSHGLSDLCQG